MLLLLGGCTQASTAVPVPMAEPPIAVTVTTQQLRVETACQNQFVTHTLPFTTGNRLREINTYESNGAGVAVNDLDGDGDLDLVFASIDREASILWNQGDLRFVVQPLDARFTRGVATVDVDGDGWLDIVFTHRGQETLSLWHNTGNSDPTERFVRRPLPGVESYAYAMAWADLTGDGALDLVTGSYNTDLIQQGIANPERNSHAGVTLYERQADHYIATPLAFNAEALAIALLDLNGDGHRDIWVANDFDLPDRIWLQSADGWQPTLPFDQTSFSTMSIDWGDVGNNGSLALFTTDMNPYDTSVENLARWLPVIEKLERRNERYSGDQQQMINMLHLPQSGEQWRNLSTARGIDASGWSWAGKFGDLDQDGYLDAYVVNGMIAENLFGHLTNGELVEENQAFRNDGTGNFLHAPEWQLGSTASGRGMTMADLDNDGDLDIVVNNLRGSAQLFENQICGGDSIQVELNWPTSGNDYGVGAQLVLETAMGNLWRDVRVTSGYLSGDPVRVHFGVPRGTALHALQIHWPDGAHSKVDSVGPGTRLIVLRQ
ncbi:MAG: CRTAC1 family protein [Caldilineaceae bacterium]